MSANAVTTKSTTAFFLMLMLTAPEGIQAAATWHVIESTRREKMKLGIHLVPFHRYLPNPVAGRYTDRGCRSLRTIFFRSGGGRSRVVDVLGLLNYPQRYSTARYAAIELTW
jgi:hypothetical protein